MIPDRVIEVLDGPAIMFVGSRDTQLRPAHTIAVGAVAHDDRRTATVFVPESRAARLLDDLRDNGRVAFDFGWVSHESYQLKGTYLSSRPTTDAEVEHQEAYRAKVLMALRKVYPEEIAKPLAAEAESLVETEEVGPLPLEGFSRPVPAFNLVRLRS